MAVGSFSVRAIVRYDATSVVTTTAAVEARVRVALKPTFALSRRLSGRDTGHSFRLSAIEGPISVNEAGQVAFLASLDGLASAVLVRDGESTRVVYDAASPPFGGLFGGPILDRRGDVLVPAYSGVFLATADGRLVTLVLPNTTVGPAQQIRFQGRAPPRMNQRGDVVFVADFCLASCADGARGVFRLLDGRLELLWFGGPLPGSLATTFDPIRLGLDGAGTVYVGTGGPTGEIYRLDRAASATRIAGAGDRVDGKTTTGISRRPRTSRASRGSTPSIPGAESSTEGGTDREPDALAARRAAKVRALSRHAGLERRADPRGRRGVLHGRRRPRAGDTARDRDRDRARGPASDDAPRNGLADRGSSS